MTWALEKETGDLVWSGVEQGIAPSPHKGTANLQNVNIATELGEVMCSFTRFQQSQVGVSAVSSGTLTASTSTSVTGVMGTGQNLTLGVWITTGTSSISGISSNTIYFMKAATSGGALGLSTSFGSAILTGLGLTGTCPFTLLTGVGEPIAKAVEPYGNGTSTVNYRYYILDSNGLVWVYDTLTFANNMTAWFCPDYQTAQFNGTPTGMNILNGWLMVFVGFAIYAKPTVNLGNNGAQTTTYVVTEFSLMSSTAIHYAFVGHQGKLYYTDGSYIGMIFPNTSIQSGVANIQSYCRYTASTTTGTIAVVIGGSTPTLDVSGGSRIPAVFFPAAGGSQPSNLTAGTVYWIALGSTFSVYAAQSGGSAINIASGASGAQYFNTFFPTSTDATSTHAIVQFSPQQLNLPYYETAQCMAETGNTLIIGANGNILYPWNQVDPTPSSLIFLPENNTVTLLTAHQMVYGFTGNKGNIYITDGSTASLIISVPDYCAGIPGTPNSYVETYFVWGDAMYLRGRIYFSIADQQFVGGSQTKPGNCGGIWSLIPTQQLYLGMDVGSSLRLENQNSYGTYNGFASVLLPSQNQEGIAPQYWSGWTSSANVLSGTYGIDFTGTVPTGTAVVETDAFETGTIFGKQKRKFGSLEYKVASPLMAGESVAINYRLNLTDAWASAGTIETDSRNLSGVISPHQIPEGQWLQLQAVLTSNQEATSSFVRLVELRLHP